MITEDKYSCILSMTLIDCYIALNEMKASLAHLYFWDIFKHLGTPNKTCHHTVYMFLRSWIFIQSEVATLQICEKSNKIIKWILYCQVRDQHELVTINAIFILQKKNCIDCCYLMTVTSANFILIVNYFVSVYMI